jgi:aminoglycoside phosphotransferase (APT) family kinase protein
LPEPDGKFCWTFVEDAGSESYLPEVPEHGILAAELLAAIHTSAAALVPDIALADKGPNVYLDSLRTASERIRRHLEEADLSEDERFTVAEISAQCDCLAACWNRVEAWIDGVPQTLVHGDCHPANLRVIKTGKGPKLVLLDWDTAGLACPAIDLALIGLHQATYWSIVRAAWPSITIQAVHGMANAGRIFQLLAMIDCETKGMTYPWPQRLIKNLTFYRAELAEAIHLSGLNR